LKRGELYRVYKGAKQDPKNYRVYIIVSRQTLINAHFSTVICAPVYTNYDGIATQVSLGIEDGLKHDSAIHCDELISLPKTLLTDYVEKLSNDKLKALKGSLLAALELQEIDDV
jgi:mRNA interferase MazF